MRECYVPLFGTFVAAFDDLRQHLLGDVVVATVSPSTSTAGYMRILNCEISHVFLHDVQPSCKLRIGVAHLRQIGRARLRVELREHGVIAVRLLQLGDPAFGIVDVAEHDRVRRAGLLAGRSESRRP